MGGALVIAGRPPVLHANLACICRLPALLALQTSYGTEFPGQQLYNAPAVVQLRRRSLSEPPAWLLMCAHIVMSDDACLSALLEALAVQPGQLARLLFEGAGAEPELSPDAWPQLPGATRLILTYANLPLDALLPRLPRLEVRCATLCALVRCNSAGRACCAVAEQLCAGCLEVALLRTGTGVHVKPCSGISL